MLLDINLYLNTVEDLDIFLASLKLKNNNFYKISHKISILDLVFTFPPKLSEERNRKLHLLIN